ncbi:hypothetical protein Tco_0674313 [Tanacetum coccineum]
MSERRDQIRGKKRPRESNASSSSTTLNHPSSSHPLEDTLDENDDESFHSNSSSSSQNISSSSNIVSRVRQNPPHETKPSLASSSIQTMLCHVILSFPLFKSSNSHTSLPPSPSSSSSPSSSMSCSNHHSNFSRKPRMSVRQVWKRKTSTPKSSPSSQKESPPRPLRVYLQSPSPPSCNPLRVQMINQLHNISTILDSHTNPSNAYIHAPPSPPPQQIHPPSHAQVEFHSSFCHYAAIRNQGASIKTLKIQIGPMSKVLQERGFQILPNSIETNPRDHVKSISTTVKADMTPNTDNASVHSEATIAQQQQNIQPQIITTVSNNNAKFPYLKKDEYEVWAMKMEYWITNNDMNIWKVIQNGNNLKRTGRDRDGRVIIFPSDCR